MGRATGKNGIKPRTVPTLALEPIGLHLEIKARVVQATVVVYFGYNLWLARAPAWSQLRNAHQQFPCLAA
jgi:hypothetical protein